MSASQHLFPEVAKKMLGDGVGDVCEISSPGETGLLVSACLRIDHTEAFEVPGEKGKRGVAVVECWEDDSVDPYLLQRIVQMGGVLGGPRHVGEENVDLITSFFVLLPMANAKLFELVE